MIILTCSRYYNIGYAIVSLVFITNAVGFILAAFFVDALRARFGRGGILSMLKTQIYLELTSKLAKTLMFGQAILTCGYITIVCTPPFPIVVMAFFFMGYGIATNLALGNVFAANLQNSTKMLGIMHGSYGIGGTVGPISKHIFRTAWTPSPNHADSLIT